ncbi:MAG: RrF2 family transcriptional regulator [Phycisphaerales bacterium]
MYGKQTETAIAAMSRLAEVYDAGKTRLSAAQIAAARQLQGPFVAKILTTLSQAGLITGAPGPGGGYALAKPPTDISLHDVYKLFEREDESLACPFGGGVCGQGDPCPLHNKLVGVKLSMDELLHNTSFEVFREAYQDKGLRPTKPKSPAKKARESFRAPLGKRG